MAIQIRKPASRDSRTLLLVATFIIGARKTTRAEHQQQLQTMRSGARGFAGHCPWEAKMVAARVPPRIHFLKKRCVTQNWEREQEIFHVLLPSGVLTDWVLIISLWEPQPVSVYTIVTVTELSDPRFSAFCLACFRPHRKLLSFSAISWNNYGHSHNRPGNAIWAWHNFKDRNARCRWTYQPSQLSGISTVRVSICLTTKC